MRRPLRIVIALFVLTGLTLPSVRADYAPDDASSSSTEARRQSDRPIRELAVAPEELGDNWVVIPESVEEIDIDQLGRMPRPTEPLALFQARYRNEADYEPGREVAPLVAEFRDERQAAIALRDYLDFIVMGNQRPDVRWRWQAESVDAGDQGVRFAYSLGGDVTAGYLFRVDTYLGGVLVKGREADEEDLLAHITDIAGWQEARLTTESTLARLSGR